MAKQRATVTADALLADEEHAADTTDRVERVVAVTQTVMDPDGKVLDTVLRKERVVALKGSQKWQVEEISFFPKNPLPEAICPAGQSPQPAPDGACKANVPVQTTKCPDGTSVPAGQMCAGQQQASTRTCPDGTRVPINQACVDESATASTTSTTTTTTECSDGQERDSNGSCQPTPCAIAGQTRNTNGDCVCPDGQEVVDNGCTSAPEPCPDPSQTRSDDGTCGVTGLAPCEITGQTRDENGTCECPSGQVVQGDSCGTPCDGDLVQANGTCSCPAGLEQVGTSCLDPCPSGQVRSGTTCACPGGTESVGGQCVAPCPAGQTRVNGNCQYPPCPYSGQYRDTADGQCKCGGGRSTNPDGSCGAYVGAPPPAPIDGIGPGSGNSRSVSFRRKQRGGKVLPHRRKLRPPQHPLGV